MAKEVVVLGAGMHAWGKWGRNFVEYGVHAARAALADATLAPLPLCTDNAVMIASAARYAPAIPFPQYLALDAYATAA